MFSSSFIVGILFLFLLFFPYFYLFSLPQLSAYEIFLDKRLVNFVLSLSVVIKIAGLNVSALVSLSTKSALIVVE